MDPVGWMLAGALSWLPRARGDGPGPGEGIAAGVPASPRPRACGDGPAVTDGKLDPFEASPRPRGWTVRPGRAGGVVPGFPRARGDGPRDFYRKRPIVSASPRPRRTKPRADGELFPPELAARGPGLGEALAGAFGDQVALDLGEQRQQRGHDLIAFVLVVLVVSVSVGILIGEATSTGSPRSRPKASPPYDEGPEQQPQRNDWECDAGRGQIAWVGGISSCVSAAVDVEDHPLSASDNADSVNLRSAAGTSLREGAPHITRRGDSVNPETGSIVNLVHQGQTTHQRIEFESLSGRVRANVARRGDELSPGLQAGVAVRRSPAQAGIAECGQVVEQGDGVAGVLGRAGAGLGGGVIDALEQRGQRELGGVERVAEEPGAPLAARDAALALGPDEASARSSLERQVDAGAEHLVAVLCPVAAHVLAVGDLLAQAAQRGALVGAQQVDERHGLSLRRKRVEWPRGGRVKGAVRPRGVADAGRRRAAWERGADAGALPCPRAFRPSGRVPI